MTTPKDDSRLAFEKWMIDNGYAGLHSVREGDFRYNFRKPWEASRRAFAEELVRKIKALRTQFDLNVKTYGDGLDNCINIIRKEGGGDEPG